MVKRGLIVFSLLVSCMFLLSAGFVSSAACSITTSCNSANTVMKLYSTTNAHGALYNIGTYGNYLCCDFTGDHACSGNNKILGLSATNNAHAQIPSQIGYTEHVCFADLSCTVTTASSCPTTYPIAMVSLSATSNAHVAQFATYSQKICCVEVTGEEPVCGNGIIETGEECDDGNYANYDGCSTSCVEESGYTCINSGEGSCCYSLDPATAWTKIGQTGSYNGGTVVAGDILAEYIFEDFCVAQGSESSIRIYKNRPLGDLLLATQVAEMLGNSFTSSWVISAANLNALGAGNSDVYFEMNNPYGGTIKGPTITLTIEIEEPVCGDGTIEGTEQCDGTNLGGATCASVMGTGYTGSLSCSGSCTFITGNCIPPTPVCGNGATESGEECDDGNLVNGDGCSSSCNIEDNTCASLGYECGSVGGVSCGTCLGGETCTMGQCIVITQNCEMTSASWSATEAVEGDSVQLNVQTTNCIGNTISFVVKEADGLGNPDDSVVNPPNPASKTITSSLVTASWVAEYQDDTDGGQTNPPEYYFIATIGSNTIQSSSASELEVIAYDDARCLGINYCANYLTQNECTADLCSVAENFESEEVTCGYGVDCECYWNGAACVDSWSDWCNDNGLINIGEQCDGTNFGPVTGCSYFGYTGGTLTCNNCVFDTSACTGKSTGVCGNNVLNTGEQCDNNILSLSNCTSFDSFTSGSLSCNNDYCLLNTRNCVGGEGPYIPTTGKCIYTDSSGDNCDDGYLDRNLVATWTGVPADMPASCHDITDRLLCPAQIKVSFFGIAQFIIAVILLIIIYFILKSRIKMMHRPKKIEKSSKKKRK